MIVKTFVQTAFQQNARVVSCGVTREAICIDPGEPSEEVTEYINEGRLHLEAIILTHGHLDHIGLANQTTMLMSESLEVQEMFRRAMTDRYGVEPLAARFRAFDTICSATQDRQDAVVVLLREKPVDLMVVIGGYNSSNTCNLARMCAAQVPTYHIADPDCLESADAIRYRPAGGKSEVRATGWLPVGRDLSIGLTSGASTPDNQVGNTVKRLVELCNPT